MNLLQTVSQYIFGQVRFYGYKDNPIRRFRTSCCALGQLSLNNDHSKEEIINMVELVKKETQNKWTPDTRLGGERALFVITTMPDEKELAERLEDIGFQCLTGFNRRNGYGPGINLMWIIKW